MGWDGMGWDWMGWRIIEQCILLRSQLDAKIISIEMTSKDGWNQSISGHEYFNERKTQKFAFKCDLHYIFHTLKFYKSVTLQ